MFKKYLADSVAAIALLVFVALGFGFYQAMDVTTLADARRAALAPPPQAGSAAVSAAAKPSDTYSLLILGDSIAKGTGDEKGRGLGGYLSQSFGNDTPKDIAIQNAAIDGLESQGLLDQIGSGNLDQPIAGSDLILISIGGNDLRRVLSADDITKTGIFRSRLDGYINNLGESLLALRSRNPGCVVVVLGIYDPYEATTTTGDALLLHQWNYETQELMASRPNTIFVPTYDLMKFNLGRYLAPDGLHPDSAGYQAIASRIHSAVDIIVAQ